MLNKILDVTRKITNIIVTFLFMVVVAVVFAQVVARYVAGSSIRWADELARFAFVWLVYLGGSITIREGRNVCFDLLLEACKGKNWKVMFTVVCAASAVFLNPDGGKFAHHALAHGRCVRGYTDRRSTDVF